MNSVFFWGEAVWALNLKRKVAIAVLPENRVSILLQKSSQKLSSLPVDLGKVKSPSLSFMQRCYV